ncbi:jg2712 [Pararge aegeria aegeria]|uniref:Jg2712 protein n=1 Tax=Pararge aegeria aegeria TaxID=348720 RepID=A0A8S4QNY5_9NEOP|nr:jg2712 [Pararge aegeria aegeria]
MAPSQICDIAMPRCATSPSTSTTQVALSRCGKPHLERATWVVEVDGEVAHLGMAMSHICDGAMPRVHPVPSKRALYCWTRAHVAAPAQSQRSIQRAALVAVVGPDLSLSTVVRAIVSSERS